MRFHVGVGNLQGEAQLEIRGDSSRPGFVREIRNQVTGPRLTLQCIGSDGLAEGGGQACEAADKAKCQRWWSGCPLEGEGPGSALEFRCSPSTSLIKLLCDSRNSAHSDCTVKRLGNLG